MVNDFGLNVLFDIAGVNCSAHTLQLAVKDALAKIAIRHRNVISLCHKVCKSLRLKSMQNEFETYGGSYKKPRLDVETRWRSTFMMVSHIF